MLGKLLSFFCMIFFVSTFAEAQPSHIVERAKYVAENAGQHFEGLSALDLVRCQKLIDRRGEDLFYSDAMTLKLAGALGARKKAFSEAGDVMIIKEGQDWSSLYSKVTNENVSLESYELKCENAFNLAVDKANAEFLVETSGGTVALTREVDPYELKQYSGIQPTLFKVIAEWSKVDDRTAAQRCYVIAELANERRAFDYENQRYFPLMVSTSADLGFATDQEMWSAGWDLTKYFGPILSGLPKNRIAGWDAKSEPYQQIDLLRRYGTERQIRTFVEGARKGARECLELVKNSWRPGGTQL